jgi:hypothetical protein
MENRFKEGEVVYERTRPSQKLVIANFAGGIYYCHVEENVHRKKLVFFERELKSYNELPAK